MIHNLQGVDMVQQAVERLQVHEPPEGYYLAFSGGKDSCVILELAKRSGVRFEAVYHYTTVDPPELVWFIRREHPEVRIVHPETTMWRLIVERHQPPVRMMRFCCGAFKESGGEGRFVVTGVRWQESNNRAKRRMVESCMRRGVSKRFLHPIIDWRTRDVWQYIRENGLSYCSLYDEGRKRIGCVMCPCLGQKRMRADAERWPKIAAAYRRACQAAVERILSNPDPEHPYKWHSGDEMYEWWVGLRQRTRALRAKPNKDTETQVMIYE